MTVQQAPKRGGGQFVGWVAVGAAAGVGILALLSVGILFVAAAAVGALVLVRRASPRPATLVGLVSGVGLPLLVVGWLNRGGPGEVCTSTATSQSCTEEWNPWPWWAAGAVLVVAGAVLHAVLARRASLSTHAPPGPHR